MDELNNLTEANKDYIANLQEELKQKEKIINELRERLLSIEEGLKKFEDIDLKLKIKDDLIENLKSSLSLKDDQIKTIKSSMDLKEGQVVTLDNSLKIKNEKIKTLEKSISLKEEQLKELASSTVEKNLLMEKDENIEKLQEKLNILNGELEKADEDLEALETENERLRNNLASASGPKIVDWTDIEISKADILKKMRDILSKASHNITIAVPDIKDLQELHLYEVRSSVNMKVSSSIDPSLEDDAELLEEFGSLDNISIRLYEQKDRFVIDRDGEELLFAIIGKNDNNNLVIHTRDSKHQRLLRSLVMEGWLRSRKIE
jgi:DNA repair exonuclease SbcCD ATPase subunit